MNGCYTHIKLNLSVLFCLGFMNDQSYIDKFGTPCIFWTYNYTFGFDEFENKSTVFSSFIEKLTILNIYEISKRL